MKRIKEKLKKLPKTSGVYLYRDKDRKIIYVGKAVNLKNRVSSYFQKTAQLPKTELLISDIRDLEYIETGSEIGAIILESELIKRYKPKYNVELKDDKNFLYLKIPKEDFPLPIFVRHPSDDKAKYLGPYTDARAVRKTLKHLRRTFPFRDKGDLKAKRACLYYHIGKCPGVCIGAVSKTDYKKNIRGLISFFEGKSKKLIKEFEREMKKASKNKDFENAAKYRDKIRDIRKINEMHLLKGEDFGKLDKALTGLRKELGLKNLSQRIESYDISNIQGKEAVGSMVVFKGGMPSKEDYRKFKIRIVKGIDDVAMMKEILRRRFAKCHPDPDVKSVEGSRKRVSKKDEIPRITRNDKKKWDELPNLILIDGGKGQLGAALEVLESFNLKIPTVGIAKKNEELWFRVRNSDLRTQTYKKIILQRDSESLYLLQRIRDEAHRFAITYFRGLHVRKAKRSALDSISGVGPKTKKKLIREFGSVAEVKKADIKELEKVVGAVLAKRIKEQL